MVHLTCHLMCKISYTQKHTYIHLQYFKVFYLMMHDLVLITRIGYLKTWSVILRLLHKDEPFVGWFTQLHCQLPSALYRRATEVLQLRV